MACAPCTSLISYLGQRCKGRNYPPGRRCCTPEDPCDEGEGDCDGRGDGGFNDGDEGCKGDLVCGSNNCLQFGLYYHGKDDCCQKAEGKSVAGEVDLKGGCRSVAGVVNPKVASVVLSVGLRDGPV